MYVSSPYYGRNARTIAKANISASTGVGEWLAFLADSDNATLKACADMTAVVASSTAMTAVVASSTAMTAIFASDTARNILSPVYGYKREKSEANPSTRITYLYDAGKGKLQPI